MTESESMTEAYGDDGGIWTRETAPQSAYTMRQVVLGLLIFAVAAAVAFGVPLALA